MLHQINCHNRHTVFSIQTFTKRSKARPRTWEVGDKGTTEAAASSTCASVGYSTVVVSAAARAKAPMKTARDFLVNIVTLKRRCGAEKGRSVEECTRSYTQGGATRRGEESYIAIPAPIA